MKSFFFLLLITPIVAFSQSSGSVVVYQGNISTNSKITDLSNKNLNKLPIIDSEVEILILDDNQLTEIPSWFTSLKNLRTLSIRNNNLIDIDVLSNCESLEEIYLTNNQNLEYIPNFRRCKDLKIVDVINTKINDLPISIRSLEGITYFKYSDK